MGKDRIRGTAVVAAMMLGMVGMAWAQGASTPAPWWSVGSGWSGNVPGLVHHGYAMGGYGPGAFGPFAPGGGRYGQGMMGGGMMGHGMMGGGMMGGGMMGQGATSGGMMAGAAGPIPPDAKPLPDADLVARFHAVLPQFPAGARVDDVMLFANNAYAQIVDVDGNGVAELIADRFTGAVVPEPGPNMMWNSTASSVGSPYDGMMGAQGRNPASVYGGGMMGWDGAGRGPMGSAVGAGEQPSYDQQQARDLADRFLEAYAPGTAVLQSQTFPGYYTFDYGVGTVQGMLSVNAYTGAVWPHIWHGAFVGSSEP